MTRQQWSDDPGNAHTTFALEAVGITLPRTLESDLNNQTRFDSSRRGLPVVDGDLSDPATFKRLLQTLAFLGILDDQTSLGANPEILTAGGLTPTVTIQAAAGNTATASVIAGSDYAMEVQINSAGTGQAAGTILRVNFAYPKRSFTDFNYQVQITPSSNAARSLAGVLGPTSRGSTTFDIDTRTALTAGQVYQLQLLIVPEG